MTLNVSAAMYKRKRSTTRRHGRKRHKGAKSGWSYRSQGDTPAAGYRHTNSRRSLAVLPRSFNVPDAVRVKIRTVISAVFVSTGGAAQIAAVVPSTLFNPFAAFGGSTHENPTANNFRTLFMRYLVLGARLTTKWYPPIAASNTIGGSSAIACQVVNNVSTAAFGSGADFEEADMTTGFRPLPLIGGWGGQKMYQSMYADMAKTVGCSRPEYAANAAGVLDASGNWQNPQSTSTNGIVLPVFQVYYQSADGVTTSTYGADLILTQYVEFSQRRRA